MEHVIHEDANQPQVGDKPQGKDDSVTISKAELEGLHRTLRETQQSERDWAAMARREPQPEPAGEPEEEIDASQFVDPDAPTGIVDGDTPEKLVDDLAAQGVAALSKRGYVTAAQAQQIAVDVASKVSREFIGRERQKMGTDATMMQEFPELFGPKRTESEMWAETSKRYQKLVAMDPMAKRTPSALYAAADAAREALRAKAATAKRRDTDDDREDESDRRQRADSQDGRTRSRREVDDTDDMMGPEARRLMKAMGITEAEYKDSRRELSGQRRRR